MKIPDTHIHLYKFSEQEIRILSKDFILLSVAEDLQSSLQNIRLAYMYESVIPAIGLHPWKIQKMSDIKEIERLVSKTNISVIGEVGLDFEKSTLSKEVQIRIFKEITKIAKEYDLSLNLHHLGAEKEIISILEENRIPPNKVYFHWVNPNMDLKLLNSYEAFIGINASIIYNPKYESLLEEFPLERILIESDAPWKYHGRELHPNMLEKVLDIIAKKYETSKKVILERIRRNFARYLS